MWLLLAASPQHAVWLEAALVPLSYLGRTLLALSLLALATLLGAYLSLQQSTPLPTGLSKGASKAANDRSVAEASLGRTVASFAFAGLGLPLIYAALVPRVGGWLEPGSATLLAATLSLVLIVFIYAFTQQLGSVLAELQPRRVARVVQPLVRVWCWLCRPLVAAVSYSSSALLGLFGLRRAAPVGTLERVRRLLAQHIEDYDELNLLSNVLGFGDTTARDAMVPRADVVWISTAMSLEEALEELHDSGHSRVPLCNDGPDQVVGYLHAKDLAFIKDIYLPGKVDLRSLARPVIFVPESARAMLLLHRFQEERSHLAIVVDEFGGMAGIITLEDLLEELVGEIRDEYDVEEIDVQTLETGELIVDGRLRLEDLEKSLGLSFGDAEEETIGGYIFGRLERGAEPGDQTVVDETTFCVEAVDGLRITQVRVIPSQPVIAIGSFNLSPTLPDNVHPDDIRSDDIRSEFVSETSNRLAN